MALLELRISRSLAGLCGRGYSAIISATSLEQQRGLSSTRTRPTTAAENDDDADTVLAPSTAPPSNVSPSPFPWTRNRPPRESGLAGAVIPPQRGLRSLSRREASDGRDELASERGQDSGGATEKARTGGLHKLGHRLARLRVPSVSTPLEPGAELDAYLAQLRRRGAINSDVRASASEKLEGEDVEEEVVAEEERQRAVPVPREHQRSVRVGLVGLPNAGKSVLANALVGGKISAVSRKVNTTQRVTLGIKTTGAVQIVMYDLPGVIAREQVKHRNIERVASAWATAAHCDVLLFVVDTYSETHSPNPAVKQLAADLSRAGQLPGLRDWRCPPSILVLTKIDKLRVEEKRDSMIEIAEGLLDVHPFFDVHYVSGEKVDGLEALEDIVQTLSRATPWEYAPDAKTDRSPEMVALEVTREKLYQRVNKELPYRCAVKHVDWKFLRDGSVRVEQEILVKNQIQRGIIVGAKGAVVGAIGLMARNELQQLWGIPVHLIINVIVDG